MDIKVKKLDKRAVIPEYAKSGDAGLDLTAISKEVVNPYESVRKVIYGTGLAIEIPRGYVGLIFPRSSVHKKTLSLANSVGVIDSGYRGEIKFIFKSNTMSGVDGISLTGINDYEIGDRVGQLIIMPYPEVKIVETDELSDSDRGHGGFGSTGN